MSGQMCGVSDSSMCSVPARDSVYSGVGLSFSPLSPLPSSFPLLSPPPFSALPHAVFVLCSQDQMNSTRLQKSMKLLAPPLHQYLTSSENSRLKEKYDLTVSIIH